MTTVAAGRKINWTNTLFIAAAHLVAVGAIVWMATGHFYWQSFVMGLVMLELCSISITAGYHRLFSHRAYKAAPWYRAILLIFGAASVQNSALAWSRDHRRHHTFTDTDLDPYNAKEGFWWSHVLWVLHDAPEDHVAKGPRVTDLEDDPLVRFQHKYYVPIAILFAAVIPMCLGFLWGDPIGALLICGFLRLVVQWHMTFTINSLAHMVGTQPYSTRNTSRDSGLIAFVSWGEGYHNFHHRFQADYRNGVRWWQFDPTKWMLWTLQWVKVVSDLRRTPDATIQRALANPRHADDAPRESAPTADAVGVPVAASAD
ncbi:MAG: fatty acid desaturase [Planctomycetota bacterium]|nr:fatty acid desaturase [Planctomycetota bacterium]